MAKIVIVEDEIIIAMDLENILENKGHRVIGMAANAQAAIRMVSELQPDLVFMDIHLQGDIDGIEIATQIRHYSQVPIIFCSSYGSKRVIGEALEVNGSSYIIKPFNTEIIGGVLAEVL